jgi:excisionase family DNA binding protein
MAEALMTIEETGRALGVSRSTVWRLIQRGELLTIRQRGRRLVQASALRKQVRSARARRVTEAASFE